MAATKNSLMPQSHTISFDVEIVYTADPGLCSLFSVRASSYCILSHRSTSALATLMPAYFFGHSTPLLLFSNRPDQSLNVLNGLGQLT